MNKMDGFLTRALENATMSTASVVALVAEAYENAEGESLTPAEKTALAMSLAPHALILADAFAAMTAMAMASPEVITVQSTERTEGVN